MNKLFKSYVQTAIVVVGVLVVMLFVVRPAGETLARSRSVAVVIYSDMGDSLHRQTIRLTGRHFVTVHVDGSVIVNNEQIRPPLCPLTTD